MDDGSDAPSQVVEPLARAVQLIVEATPDLSPADVMVIGATCRDLLHHRQGHTFALAATQDVDLAVAIPTWSRYQHISLTFPRSRHTGISFRVAGLDVDIVPFGGIENPRGTVAPPSRPDEPFSVWSLAEVFAGAGNLDLGGGLRIRLPTVPGYAASKLAAWLDRSGWYDHRDARDIALILFWYEHSRAIQSRLWDTVAGQALLADSGADVAGASAHLLGRDIASTIGAVRRDELLQRLTDPVPLAHHLDAGGSVPLRNLDRRADLIAHLIEGLRSPTAT